MNFEVRLRCTRRTLLSLLAASSIIQLSAADSKTSRLPQGPYPAVFTKSVPASISDLKAMERHVETLVKKVSPAVVALEMNFASGSGVIISSNGLILTAAHVLGGATKATVTFPDGKTVHAKALGKASDADAGLLKITEPGPWPCLELGGKQQDAVGDWVLALGHPGGFDSKRSLVVRLGRVVALDSDTLQTDCTISPGDSGGPVINMAGNVIGIHSFISLAMADNFHVPVISFSGEIDKMSKPDKKL
jgi:serine protease Do